MNPDFQGGGDTLGIPPYWGVGDQCDMGVGGREGSGPRGWEDPRELDTPSWGGRAGGGATLVTGEDPPVSASGSQGGTPPAGRLVPFMVSEPEDLKSA
jgi:hypothetical protein